MKFGPAPLHECEGAILAHAVYLPDGRLRKGIRLEAADIARLAAAGVHCDHRGDRLRFGFGLCTTAADVDRAIARTGKALAD